MAGPGWTKSQIVAAIILLVLCLALIMSFSNTISENWRLRRGDAGFRQLRWTAGNSPLGIVRLAPKDRRTLWDENRDEAFPRVPAPASRREWVQSLRASMFLQGLTPTTSCLQTRYGILGDGGKTLCNVQQFLTNSECLVYSVGVQYTCEVEMQLNRDFPQCTILMFDPTSKEFFKTARCCKVNNMQCIPKALGGGDGVAEKDKVGMAGDTLTELMKQHGHAGRTLNLLKMDIEGSEYNALEYYMNSTQTAFPRVHLLLMEIHNLADSSIRERLKKLIVWLESLGLSVYYVERNPYFPMTGAEIALVNRSLLVRV
eukprot:scpid56146/ scgid20424/ 